MRSRIPLWALLALQLPAANPQPGQLAVASLNMARKTDVPAIARELSTQKSLQDFDLLLLQEVAGQTKETSVAEALASKLGYHVVAFPSSPAAPDQGLAILSKYPLDDIKIIPLKRYNLKFHSRVRFAIAATAHTPQGPIRAWNVHLDSRISSRDRLAQLAPILEDAIHYRGPALIGGDFNTTWFQWFFNVFPTRPGSRQVTTVRSELEKAGFRTPLSNELVTYPFLSQHLDWIFARGLEPRDSGVAPMKFSDHHAVWTTFDPDGLLH
jgi:endonuclease/exonuclease/phosphatase (EEP) superfamily protein YafD